MFNNNLSVVSRTQTCQKETFLKRNAAVYVIVLKLSGSEAVLNRRQGFPALMVIPDEHSLEVCGGAKLRPLRFQQIKEFNHREELINSAI